MKDRDTPFTPAGFFALRTPLLPFDELLAWGEGLEAAGETEPVRLADALRRDRERLRERLRAALARPELREALYVATPDLADVLELWMRDPESDRGQRAERPLVRYFERTCGRATPFGLNAGCSVGTAGDRSRLALAGQDEYRRHTRLDMDYLCGLTAALAAAPAVQSDLRYRPNPTLYRAAGRLRYVETREAGDGRTHHLVALEPSPPLLAALEVARDGASIADIAASLVGLKVEPDNAARFASELLAAQVVVADLEPPVTGPQPLDALLDRLDGRPEIAPVARALEETRRRLVSMDEDGLGLDVERYRYVEALLGELPAALHRSRVLQIDLTKPAEATLGPRVMAELLRGAELLHLLWAPKKDDLAWFRDRFLDRYGRREVPLVEALDEEAGIGFGNAASGAEPAPLLRGIDLVSAEEPRRWEARDAFLMHRLGEALATGAQEIVLERSELEAMAVEGRQPLPDAFAVQATLAAPSPEALERGDFQVVLRAVTGPSGATMLGRFCHPDPALRAHVEAHLRAEEASHPEAIFAEVACLPEGRVGNVLIRPLLRGHEIPFLGRSGAAEDRQIPVTDLMVSLDGPQIVLRSARLGRRVVPRLTTAHNFTWRSVPLYRFLCELQGDGRARALFWDWGLLGYAPFLPRVRAGRLVLAAARWRLLARQGGRLRAGDATARFAAVQAWRATQRLPRWVVLAQGDNALPLDLDNVLSVEAFLDALGPEDAVVRELLPAPQQLCAYGPEGRFVHELVVPFARRDAAATAAVEAVSRGAAEAPPVAIPLPTAAGRLVKDSRTKLFRGRPTDDRSTTSALVEDSRTKLFRGRPSDDRSTTSALVEDSRTKFAPGGEWLYVKLYQGPASLDDLLREWLPGVVARALSAGADSWSYLRYGDPGFHLRLRFHGPPARLRETVLPLLESAWEPLLAEGRVWRVQLDTYEREVERYGGVEGVGVAERIFYADSDAALALLGLLTPGDEGDEARWRLAALSVDRLLSDFRFDLEAKRKNAAKLRDGYGSHPVDKRLRHQLADKYRAVGRELDALLDSTAADEALGRALPILARRWARLAPAVDKLAALERAGRLSVPLSRIARSHVHMHLNRLWTSAPREQELVLYDLLERAYASRLARRAGAGKRAKSYSGS